MFRYHRILYRRLLRAQSTCELNMLREESASFPTLMELIDDELKRRASEPARRSAAAAGPALMFGTRSGF
jgi:hypothetical protein